MKTYHWGLLVAVVAWTTVVGSNCGGGAAEPVTSDLSQLLAERSGPVESVSLEEAQGLVEYPIAQPVDLPPDMSLTSVLVRKGPQEPEQVDSIELVFSGPDYGFSLLESHQALERIGGATQPITIDGVDGEIRRDEKTDGESVVTIAWTKGGLSFIAAAFLGDEFTEEALLTILGSIP